MYTMMVNMAFPFVCNIFSIYGMIRGRGKVRSPKGVRFKIRMQLDAKRGISKAQVYVCVLLRDYNLGSLRWNICQTQVSLK